MTLALWCIVIAALLPYAAAVIAKSDKGFDNADPRGWLAKQSGYRQRANAAQQNSFEAFPFFAAGVIVAHYLHAPQLQINALAVGFIGARILYLIMYISNKPTLRSLCWVTGFGCVVGLFVISA
jgi:uncharacterized MAPEG superfamily protein